MEKKLYHKINAPFMRDMATKGKPLDKTRWAVYEFELLKDIEWVAYEKLDGMNIRIHFDGERVEFGGRTEKADIPEILLEYLNKTFTLEKMKKAFPDLEGKTVTLFGEGMSHKIQSGGKYFKNGILGTEGKGVAVVLFDIFIDGWYLKDHVVHDIAVNMLGVRDVPFVETGTLPELFFIVEKGLKSSFGDFYAEGLVAKPSVGLFDRSGKRIVTKIKHKDFFKSEGDKRIFHNEVVEIMPLPCMTESFIELITDNQELDPEEIYENYPEIKDSTKKILSNISSKLEEIKKECPECKGKGKIDDGELIYNCEKCMGTGRDLSVKGEGE